MNNIETQKVNLAGVLLDIPTYFEQIEALLEDPPDATVFVTSSPYAQCFIIGYEIEAQQMIPTDQDSLIGGIRQFLTENQGIIECEANGEVAYSIVKTLKKPRGVQYTLTFQKIVGEKIVFIQGSFEEDGTTGVRDSMVYAFMSQAGEIGTKDNPLEGWSFDPYDENIHTGALMNQSENRRFDSKFPGSPLMICRELLGCLLEK